MTDQEVIEFFAGRQLPTGRVQYSSYEATDDAANMVKLGIDRMKRGGQGSDTAKAALIRFIEYLKGLEEK